ncbi:TolC family protein [Limnobacter litoralis]|nr:TolC family protein [Limnobacter litoralis]
MTTNNPIFIRNTIWCAVISALCTFGVANVQAQESAAPETPNAAEARGTQASTTEPAKANPLQHSVILGLEKSPKLAASTHGLEAIMDEANGNFGAMLPTVDLRGQTGRERSNVNNGDTNTYNNHSYGIEARENVFNGFASQARYLGAYSAAMQKYFQVLDQANQIAFDSATAHVNVSRYQALTKLAEENLNYLKDLKDKIEDKVKSGVARQSDLEQAKSRYTLALSNLATEKANTFSAMATYQREVDAVWPINDMGEYIVKANFEVDNPERLVFALNHHPLIKAANANIRAANYAVTAASEGFYPRIDVRAKTDVYSNYLSTFDERQISSVDVLASMNLFRGGADKAARSAAVNRKMRSQDDKLATCRLIRQIAQTSLYDVVSSQRKMNYFKAQAESITNARTAYEQQFSIGRRSLLDLLSAEDEFHQAQRALINIEADLSVSKLKLLATTGQLIQLFGVENYLQINEPTRKNVLFYKEQTDQSADEPCPASLINLDDFKLPNLGFDDALKTVNNGLSDQPVLVAAADTGGQQASLSDPTFVSSKLIEKTNAWVAAWQAGDVTQYLDFYASAFKPEEGTHSSWVANRTSRLKTSKDIQIHVSDFQVIPSFDDPDVYDISFLQDYKSANYKEKSRKVLTWKKVNNSWQIIREQNLPVTAHVEKEKRHLASADL